MWSVIVWVYAFLVSAEIYITNRVDVLIYSDTAKQGHEPYVKNVYFHLYGLRRVPRGPSILKKKKLNAN